MLEDFFNDGDGPAEPTAVADPAPVAEPTALPNANTPDPEPEPVSLESQEPTEPSTSDDDDFGSPFDDKGSKAEPTEPSSSDEDFDQETWRKLEEMGLDPHTGIKFRENREQLRQALKQVEELKANAGNSEEVQELRAKVASYENLEGDYNELKRTAALNDYRQTDEYVQEVTRPFQQIEKISKLLEKSAGLDEGSILKAIASDDPNQQNQNISALEENLDSRTLSRIHGMADQMLMLYGRDEIANEAEARLTEYNERKTNDIILLKNRSVYLAEVENLLSIQNKINSISEDGGNSSK